MREGTAYSYKQTKGQRPGGALSETVEKACHCEPVRTLARQSVSKTHNSRTFPKIPS